MTCKDDFAETKDLSAVTLAVLAGGLGKRMGIPKAWMQLGGESALGHLHRRVTWPGPTILVSSPATRFPPSHELFETICVDPVSDEGPLRGVITALQHSTTDIVIVVTVDMPGIGYRELAWMAKTFGGLSDCHGLMCRVTGRDMAEMIEPFPSVFHVAAMDTLTSRVTAGRRDMRSLCTEPRFAAVSPPDTWDLDVWSNLNFPSQLADYERGSQQTPAKHALGEKS